MEQKHGACRLGGKRLLQEAGEEAGRFLGGERLPLAIGGLGELHRGAGVAPDNLVVNGVLENLPELDVCTVQLAIGHTALLRVGIGVPDIVRAKVGEADVANQLADVAYVVSLSRVGERGLEGARPHGVEVIGVLCDGARAVLMLAHALKLGAVGAERVLALLWPVLGILALAVNRALRALEVLARFGVFAQGEVEAVHARLSLDGLGVSLGVWSDSVLHRCLWR